jgi:hypothetical protein
MTLVFSVEFSFTEIDFRKVGVVLPSISVSIGGNDPVLLWTPDDKVQDGTTMQINRAYQVMVTADVFQAIDTWPISLNLTMARDQVALGKATYEFRSLLASALTHCGASQFVTIQASMRDFRGEIAALLTFETRIIYYPGSEHRDTVEIIVSQPLQAFPPHQEFYSPRMAESRGTRSSGSRLSMESPAELESEGSVHSDRTDPKQSTVGREDSEPKAMRRPQSFSSRRESNGTLKSTATLDAGTSTVQHPRKLSDASHLSDSAQKHTTSAAPKMSGFSDDFEASDP